jgi:hypothetical protein
LIDKDIIALIDQELTVIRSLTTTCLIFNAACFFACNKNSSEFRSNETNKKIAVLRSTSEFSTQVQLFNLLSAEEKLQFWKSCNGGHCNFG